jgi:transposase
MTPIVNYCYRIYPDASQEETMLHWLEISRKVYNYALREIKDWVNSRKCSLDYCSLEREYIIPADKPFPTYYAQQNELPKAKKKFPLLGEAPSQVLQTTIRRLHDAWNYFQSRGRRLSSLQEVWTNQVHAVSSIQNQPHYGMANKLAQSWEDAYQLASTYPRGVCG